MASDNPVTMSQPTNSIPEAPVLPDPSIAEYKEDDDHVVIAGDEEEINMDALSISVTHNDKIASRLDELISTTMKGKMPSVGVPELVFYLACPMHLPDIGLGHHLLPVL